MPTTAKAIREKQGDLYSKIQEHRDKITRDDYKFDSADEQIWERMNTEFNDLEKQARQIESADDIIKQRNDGKDDAERELRGNPDKPGDPNTAPLTGEERAQCFDLALVRYLGGELNEQQRGLVKRGEAQKVTRVRRGKESGLELRLNPISNEFRQMQYMRRNGQQVDSRALAFGAGAGNAGTLGPEMFINNLERNMLFFGPMLQVATVIQTDHGRTGEMPTVDDTGNEGDIVGEAADVSAAQDPTISEITFPTYKIRSKKVIYSAESEEDSVFDLPALLGSLLGERIGRGMNNYLTVGTNSGQPQGAVKGAAQGATFTPTAYGTDPNILADAFIDLFHSVDPAYRSQTAMFMLHDSILSIARKLKNENGDYLFRWEGGIGERIMISGINRPYAINNHMDSTVADTKEPIAYGDFSKYWARLVRTIRVRRYVEMHGDNDQDAIQVFMRFGGKIVNAGTAPIKKLVVAA